MTTLYRDILIALTFTLGIAGFISGQFIVSTILFAISAVLSNTYLNREFYKSAHG